MGADQTGWDWFSLSFDTGEKLMGFRLRSAEGGAFTAATWIAADGGTTAFPDGAFQAVPLETAQIGGRQLGNRRRNHRPSPPEDRQRRRIAALIYDSFLILAIWMLSSLAILAVTDLGESLGGPLYQGFLYLELMAFYVYFWTFKGQTLGMQVWRLLGLTVVGGK